MDLPAPIRRVLPLPRLARISALVASLAIATVGVMAGAVRLLPWLLDPAVSWRVAAPFARGLAAVALEAALLVGWPVGWALACVRFVETGEARVLLTLGESPAATARRLVPQGAVFATVLAAVALVYGSDASAPGRVATELVAQARRSCEQASAPTTYAIPFTDMTWLCAPGRGPRLVGSAPGGMAGAVVTATGARIAGDFRALDLDDAQVLLGARPGRDGPDAAELHVSVAALSMHGMVPWASASSLPAALRAILLAITGWSTASMAVYGVLRRGSWHGGRRAARRGARAGGDAPLGEAGGRVGALALGSAGPLAALGVVRLLERADAHAAAFLVVPLAGMVACAVTIVLLSRLRWPWHAAS